MSNSPFEPWWLYEMGRMDAENSQRARLKKLENHKDSHQPQPTPTQDESPEATEKAIMATAVIITFAIVIVFYVLTAM